MARITVDDCIKYFPNRFELTLAATNRARQIALGASPLVEANRDKPTVVALRELADSLERQPQSLLRGRPDEDAPLTEPAR